MKKQYYYKEIGCDDFNKPFSSRFNATASQRAEALLRTINLWK